MAHKEDVIQGTWIESGHGAITRMLLEKADHDTKIISKGRRYYNASDFPLHTFILHIIRHHTKLIAPTMQELVMYWRDASVNISKTKTIVIGMTPPRVTREYLAILDGGIIHEALHSLYTVRGDSVDMTRVKDIIDRCWTPGLRYSHKHSLFASLWNIYEDAMIERYGIQEWAGARKLLCRTHEDVWELEQRDKFEAIDHITCYLRDIIEEWTDRAPLDEYDEYAKAWTDYTLAREIADSDKSLDSYDTLELALRTLGKLHNAIEEQLKQQEQQQKQGSGEDKAPQGGKSSKSQQKQRDNQDANGNSGSSDSESGNSEPGNQGEKSGDSEGAQEGSGDSPVDVEGQDKGEDPASAPESSQEASDDVEPPAKNMEFAWSASTAKSTKAMLPSDALVKRAQDGLDTDFRRPRPYTTARDRFPIAPKDAKRLSDVKRHQKELQPYVAAIKSQLALLLRGQRKTRTLRNLKRGRKISNRTLVNVATQRVPKPFEKKTHRRTENTAVQIVLDLSGSMSRGKPHLLMMAFSEVLGALGIKWSAIGFQEGSSLAYYAEDQAARKEHAHEPNKSINSMRRELRDQFTRFGSVHFPIFHDFEDPNDPLTLTRLLDSKPSGGTPLMDGIWEGAKRIRARKEERKMLIVITDGNHSRQTSLHAHPIMRNMYDDLTQDDVDVLFVGYQGSETIDLSFLPKEGYIHVKRIEQFTKEVNGWIHRRLKQRMSR